MNYGRKYFLIIFVLILIFIEILLSRKFFSDHHPLRISPEKFYENDNFGQDAIIGILSPALQIKRGENFYSEFQTYGPSLSIIFIPIISLFNKLNICNLEPLVPCRTQFLGLIILVSILVWSIFLFLIINNQKNRKLMIILPLIIFIFSLTFPGETGILRLNPDILLSGATGILMYYQVNNFQERYSVKNILISGIISGILISTKPFLVFFAIPMIFLCGKFLIYIISVILTYALFSTIPHIFGINHGFWDPLIYPLISQKYIVFEKSGYLMFNHSLRAVASKLSGCQIRENCRTDLYTSVMTLGMGAVTFMSPFLFYFFPLLKNRKTKLLAGLLSIRKHNKLIPLYFALAAAFINLLPDNVFGYRLYYCIPVTIIILSYAGKNIKTILYLLISYVFLINKGLWLCLYIDQKSLCDPRIMNIFTIGHFVFLILSALEISSVKSS